MSNLSMEQQKYFDEMKGLVGQMTVEQKDQFAGMKGIVREMTDEQRRQHTELKGQVGALYDTVKSGFQIIEGSVSKVICRTFSFHMYMAENMLRVNFDFWSSIHVCICKGLKEIKL